MALSTVLAPDFPGTAEALLAEIDSAGTPAAVSAFAFTLAQLPLLAGLLGIGHLLRSRAPILSNVGAWLGVVGVIGHSVYGDVTMVQLDMAADTANHEVHADILRSVESGPAVAFMAMGLLGTPCWAACCSRSASGVRTSHRGGWRLCCGRSSSSSSSARRSANGPRRSRSSCTSSL